MIIANLVIGIVGFLLKREIDKQDRELISLKGDIEDTNRHIQNLVERREAKDRDFTDKLNKIDRDGAVSQITVNALVKAVDKLSDKIDEDR